MKNCCLISVLFMLFLVVSCDSGLKFENPNDPNNQNDSSSDKAGRGEIYGECYPNRTCNDDLVCDVDYNVCIKDKEGSADGSSDNNELATDTEINLDVSDKAACYAIYECFIQCRDKECAQACFDAGDPGGQSTFMEMYNCWDVNGCLNAESQGEYSECVLNNCYSEVDACGLMGGSGEDADTSYNSPYGSLSLALSVNQIANDTDDSKTSTIGIVESEFATGTYGNGSTSILPYGAQQIQSQVRYYAERGVQVLQIPIFQNGNGYSGGNPLVLLNILGENSTVGTLNVSPFNDSQAHIMVVSVNWDLAKPDISCVHALGQGSLNITYVGDIANHGSLFFNGNITLYNPKNYNFYGDISADIPYPVCSPVQ